LSIWTRTTGSSATAARSKRQVPPHVSLGLATSDIAGDSDLDFAIVDLDGGVRLFRNEMTGGNWVQQTRTTPGPEWHPEDITKEGDVKRRMHVHTPPLKEAFGRWGGGKNPATAFTNVEQRVSSVGASH